MIDFGLMQDIYCRTSLYILCLLICGTKALSQSAQFDISLPETVGMNSASLAKMDAYFHELVDNGQIAGIQTAIIRKDQLIHFDTYGNADIEAKKQLDSNSIFRLYSMTKPIVSVALLQLWESGQCKLNDPIDKYLPEFKRLQVFTQSGKLHQINRPIRIKDLLTHTSGIGNGNGAPPFLSQQYKKADLWSSLDNEEFAKKMSELPLYFVPGTNWKYGFSTHLVGRIIEVVSGQNLDEYLKEHIFEPLEMNDTYFQLPLEKIGRFTVSYVANEDGTIFSREQPESSRYVKPVTLFAAGGGLVSTSFDYLKFCRMLLNGGKINDHRIVNKETIRYMTKDHLDDVRTYNNVLPLPKGETGFGLGVAIAAYKDNPERGVYGWGGALGTYFRIDEKEELIYLLMIQLSPYRQLGLRKSFQEFVNAAIIKKK